MDEESVKAEEVDRLANYPMNPMISQIHQKIGTFHIVRDNTGVRTMDTSLDDVSAAPVRDPSQEMRQDDSNFLGEINVGVEGHDQ